MSALILASLLAVAMPLPAAAQEVHAFNVSASDPASAILAFGDQAGIQILASADDLKDKKLNPVSGDISTEDALNDLLAGTGLDHRYVGDRAVALVSNSSAGSVASSETSFTAPSSAPGDHAASQIDGKSKQEQAKKGFWDRFRLAQVDQGTSSGASSVEKENDQASKKKKADQLEEVVVTGSRIPTTAVEQVQPVRSYTREDIENSGQTTLGEFLSTLPDVSTTANSTLQLGLAGAQAVQLHGLPIGTTLTLLDGQRLETNGSGYFDLSNIPIAAVERIEILPVGASAVYGADALGGAVNTILRKNFDGLEVNATLDHAPDVNNPSANLAWGKGWNRGSVSLIGSYQEQGELLGTQREPWSLTSLPTNLAASTVSAIASTSCAPGNVYSLDGSNLPGLSSPEAAIPAAITGRPTIGQFSTTAGKQNLCNSERYTDITPQSQREGALLLAHYEVAESIDLFTQVLFAHGHLQNQLGPQIDVSQSFGGTVAANNPYNPFGKPVNVSFAYPGAGQTEIESTSFLRPMIGLRGSFLSDWHYEVTAYYSRDKNNDDRLTNDFQNTSNALSSSNPATALNPFTSGAPGSPQLLSSLIDSTESLLDDRIVGGQGIIRGPVLQLPAGPLQAVIGSEYSQEKQTSSFSGFPALSLQRNTYAVFSEARMPLLAGSGAISERLALTLAGRYDHSNDYGGKATWQSGLLWRATDALSFRGGYGLSYQAPLLSEISGTQTVAVFPPLVPDPFRGDQSIAYPVSQVFGPSFNLKPETGDSFTLGLEYSSHALPGLHASLTWYDLKIANYIAAEPTSALVAYPNLFPGAVTRAPPTVQDQQQGFLGVITQINNTFYNYGDLNVAGFDADIRYAIDTVTGTFTPSLAISNVYRWQSALLPGTPAIDGVSEATSSAFGGGVGWSPRWKGTAGLAWRKGPLSMTLAGRYIGRYLDYQLFVPNTNETGNTWLFDVNARAELGQAFASKTAWLTGAYVSIGAVNLLNKTPPFSYSPFFYDIQEYDIRGRFVYVQVGVKR